MRPLDRAPVDESAISPRFGATVTIPRLHWTFRAFYGHYYQAPPHRNRLRPAAAVLHQQQRLRLSSLCPVSATKNISSASPSLTADGSSTPITSEPTSPIFSTTTTSERPTSFSPSPISQALIRGWELTLRSPRFAHRAQLHLAYSNQIAEGGGTITGGLTDFTSLLPDSARSTTTSATRSTSAATSPSPGAPMLPPTFTTAPASATLFPAQPYPGDYLPQHTTFDLSLGKDFGERFSASLTALNVANRRVELRQQPHLRRLSTGTCRAKSTSKCATGSIIEKRDGCD